MAGLSLDFIEFSQHREADAARSPAVSARPERSLSRQADHTSRGDATWYLTSPAQEVPILAEARDDNAFHPIPPRECRPAADSLAHELNEALFAIGNYMLAARMILAADDPASSEKLACAIDGAATQAERAAGILRRAAVR